MIYKKNVYLCLLIMSQVTIFSAFSLGFCLYGLSQLDAVISDWSLPAALLFGVITSAVDPVAVSQHVMSVLFRHLYS